MPTDVATDDLAALAPEAKKRSGVREILLRVLSAAILAPLGAWAVWTGGLAIVAATAACAVLASYEWTRMAAQTDTGWANVALGLAMGVCAGGAAIIAPYGLEYVAFVALAGSAAVSGLAWLGKASVSSMAFGAIYTSLPFGSFVWVREANLGGHNGQLFLLAILAIVWATDIAAYFAGRGFGGPLLSPKDSPNKTWTGAIGALVCAGLAGAAVARAFGGDFMHWLVFSLALSVVAQGGDLLESRFKRLYGVKDTSGIVPGHGGVLDRLDALMAAAVVAALILRFLPILAPGFGSAGAP
jgi:phosphatidate cytidylyltransferase